MKISHKWLQTYFEKPLPESEKIAELLTFGIFEVEGIEKKSNDDVIDVKVLPDRACYCLSHEGIARELSALLPENKFTPRIVEEIEAGDVPNISAKIEAKDYCSRYLALRILDANIDETPKWIEESLSAVGQKSINFLVDLANFAMLDIGEPMHVFNTEFVKGEIKVRNAKEGEKITTLDNKEVNLNTNIVVISDEDKPLAIAGIKGGKDAETTKFSKDVIVEAASFDASSVRKVSSLVGIKTDSSKRFENDVDVNLPDRAIKYFANLVKKYNPEAIFGNIISAENSKDIGDQRKIVFTSEFISKKLGVEISGEEIIDILKRGVIETRREGALIAVYPASYRKDLNIQEDVVEEVGRLYGYEKLEAKLPKINSEIMKNKEISLENMTRNFLIQKGFSEIQTYTLAPKGEIEIANPLSSDKNFYRASLQTSMDEKIKYNLYYADLLGLSKIKLFEIGRIYKGGREFTALSIGIGYKKAKKGERVNDEIKEIRDALFAHLQSKVEILCTIDDTGGIISKNGKQIGMTNNIDGILEVDFESLTEDQGVPEGNLSVLNLPKEKATFKKLSEYPFIVRDVAVFVPSEIPKEKVLEIISRQSGELAQRIDLFDEFQKGEKTSYGYRIVFQSFEKTLTDLEAQKIMESVYEALKKEGWEIR